MESIKNLALVDRPREKLVEHGVAALNDEEILAILLGSANLIPESLPTIAEMDLQALCTFRGVGPAKAAILLAAAEYCRRATSNRTFVIDEQASYEVLRALLSQATQLQYILLLISNERELLAFMEAGSVLPDMTWVSRMAIKAGAGRILLGRNGWPAFSNTESRYLQELQLTCAALDLVCEGLMSVGPERFKMI